MATSGEQITNNVVNSTKLFLNFFILDTAFLILTFCISLSPFCDSIIPIPLSYKTDCGNSLFPIFSLLMYIYHDIWWLTHTNYTISQKKNIPQINGVCSLSMVCI